MFKASVCLVVDSNRVSLLAYSPLAMGLLSGKYLTPDGGPPDARLNLYRGTTLAFLPFPHNLYKEVSQCPSATNQSWGTCSLVTVAVWLRILRFLFVLVAGCYAEAECRYSLSKPNVIPAISAYMEIAQRHGISPVALAIGFVLRRPLVASVVIGATKTWQLQEIIKATGVDIGDEILAEIDAVHEHFPNPTP
jgi:aryl-alcohol dehydrogenase-like predicted oxidoreductase